MRRIAGGLAIASALTALAFAARSAPGLSALSPLILGVAFGMIVGNVAGVPAWARPGLAFATRRVLRLGIVLLGLQLTLGQVASVGLSGLAIIAVTLVATFVFTRVAGRLLGVEAGLTELIAAGTSVCGASAVIATNEVTRAPDEDVAYAVACVTIFGSIAMLVYPLLPALLGLGAEAYGLWAGASIHEVAQVVAAAYQGGDTAGELGTVAKLSRVMLLAPLVLSLGLLAARRHAAAPGWKAPPPPYFVFGFAAMVLVASSGVLPSGLRADSALLTQILLTVALAALGMETSFRKLAGRGVRPLLLGAAASAFIALFSLALVGLLAIG